jgi:GMP synthase (glutamine-hydrolysing)
LPRKSLADVPRVLIVQHVAWEDPGIVGETLRSAGAKVKVIKLHRGQQVPIAEAERGEFDCIFGLGSPSTAYEPKSNTNHYDEVALMKAVKRRRIPSFNICYSMQLFSVANGGEVAKNPKGREVGFCDLTRTKEGREDPVARHCGKMLQWHGDMVEKLPQGAVLLASSAMTENQLAVVDGIHYLVQGDGQAARPAMLKRWFKEDGNWARGGLSEPEEDVMAEAAADEDENVESYSRMVRGFLDLAKDRGRQSLERA